MKKLSTWDKVMAHKKNDTRHKGVANTLREDEVDTLIATVDFFGGNTKQATFDLWMAKYRIFDWLAMGVMGGDNSRIGKMATKVLVYSFLKVNGDIDAFVDDLRVMDYDIDHRWEKIELEKEYEAKHPHTEVYLDIET